MLGLEVFIRKSVLIVVTLKLPVCKMRKLQSCGSVDQRVGPRFKGTLA